MVHLPHMHEMSGISDIGRETIASRIGLGGYVCGGRCASSSDGSLASSYSTHVGSRRQLFFFLALLGLLAARAGGSPVIASVTRVTFWGALAMGLTAGVGALFGVAA